LRWCSCKKNNELPIKLFFEQFRRFSPSMTQFEGKRELKRCPTTTRLMYEDKLYSYYIKQDENKISSGIRSIVFFSHYFPLPHYVAIELQLQSNLGVGL